MKKKTSFSTTGQRADIGDLTIFRILPNRYTDAVGPFVFLDHVTPKVHTAAMNSGTGAHPHRGIATLTYLIEGEAQHFDSAGNSAKVYSGGIQWMKAGSGILHDETLNVDTQAGTNRTHAFQFWINLPSKNKLEKPEYIAIQASEVPQKQLPDNGGWVKVIAGDYKDLHSKIPAYSQQFIYHVHLQPGHSLNIPVEEKIEVAAFLPLKNAMLNDVDFQPGEFIEFDRTAGDLVLENKSSEATDIMVFGGEHYAEPIVAEGPFVMNSPAEIGEAYRDYHSGKYGKIQQLNA